MLQYDRIRQGEVRCFVAFLDGFLENTAGRNLSNRTFGCGNSVWWCHFLEARHAGFKLRCQ
jgi:hypothetical protein